MRGLAHGDALGKRKGSGGEILGFGPWSLVLLVTRPRCATGNGRRSRPGAQWPGRGENPTCDEGGRFWCAFLATFARHWYTGKRVLDEISERSLSTQKRRYRRRNVQLSHPRMMLRCAFLATALVGVVDFGAHFWPPLHGIGIPGSGFWTKFRSGF